MRNSDVLYGVIEFINGTLTMDKIIYFETEKQALEEIEIMPFFEYANIEYKVVKLVKG